MRRYNPKTVIVILVLTLIFTNGLAFDWRRILSVAEKGDDSIQPLKLVLIFDFSTLSCRDENEYYFLSPLTRISYSKMYEILDEMNENSNLRAVFALSYKYIDDIKKYSVDGMDDYLKHESQVELSKYIPGNVPKPTNISEWNYIWLPELLKKSFPADSPINSYTSIYRMIASSLIGRLIALHSDKRIEVAALPYSGAPLSVIMNSHGKDWADINIKYSLNKLKSVFGSVTVFYPPLLDLSEDVLDILRDNKVMWTFSSYFSSSEPIIYNGVKIIGVDISLSEEIKKISTDEDFINWLSQIHRLQKEGKKPFAIVVDAHWWLFKSYEFKSAFLKVLSNDKYIKTVLPGDLEYKTAEKFIESSEVGDVTLWLKNKNRIYLWNRFNTLLSYYKSHEKFLRDSEKYKVILNISFLLNEFSLKLINSTDVARDDILKCIDLISKRTMVMLGEDPEKITPLKNVVENIIHINTLQEKPRNVNGVEDEGYWSLASKIDGEKVIEYIKMIGLDDYLAISIKLKENARNYIGKSYCLNIELGDILYKIHFKLWDGRVLVYKISENNYIFQNIEEPLISIWDVVEFYMKVRSYPVEFKVELDDSRQDVIIESVPKTKTTIVEYSGR